MGNQDRRLDSTTSRYPFFIAKAPPPSLPADQQEASTESPISEPGTSAQHCWKGEWGIWLSSRHRIAVDNPTDHRESAEGDAANLPRESSVSPSFLRPVPAWSMWSQGLPKPTPSLHGPADPGFTIPPQGPQHRSVPLKGAVFRTLPSNGTLANAPPRESLRDPLPPNPEPLIRPQGSLQRPPGRVRTSLGVHLHRELPPFAEVPSLLAPPALVVAFLRASLLY